MGSNLRLDALTGLRFLAAFHVLLYHYAPGLGAQRAPWLLHIVEAGYAAVGLFYVLSGFILVAVYGGEELSGEGRRRFWIARFARVYPAYLLAALLWLPVVLIEGPAPDATLGALVTILGVQAWFPSLATVWNFPAWSVSVEAFFYAVFPLALMRLRGFSRVGVWVLLAATWAAAVAPPLIQIALSQGDGPGVVSPGSFAVNLVKYHPLVRLPEFLFGMGIGRLYATGWRPARWPALHLAAAALLVLTLACSDRIPYLLIHNGLLLPVYGALVIGLASSRSPLERLLAWGPMVLLGDASYSLYILQEPVPILARWLAVRAGVTDPWLNLSKTSAVLLLMVGVSVLSLFLLERPARTLIRDLARRSPGGGSSPR